MRTDLNRKGHSPDLTKGSAYYSCSRIPVSRQHIQESDANENLHELRTSKGNIHNWGRGVGGWGYSSIKYGHEATLSTLNN